MRTPLLVVAFAVAIVATAPVASASGDGILQNLLEKLGVVPPPADPNQEPVPEPIDLEAPTIDADSLIDQLTETVASLNVPGTTVGKAISLLGLNLVDGMFGGIEGGGEVMAASMDAVVAKPASSLVIASVSIALVAGAGTIGGLIQRYGSLGGIPLYTRIAKSALLENNVRQQIFDLIKQNPGINVSDISRRLDIAWGTATHHLQKLRHEHLVSIRVASNQKCYFPNGGTYSQREMDVMSAVKHPTAKQIAEFLIRNGPRCHRDVTDALGLTPALVSFHANKLVDAGVVARERQGRNTIFTALEATLEPAPRAVSE